MSSNSSQIAYQYNFVAREWCINGNLTLYYRKQKQLVPGSEPEYEYIRVGTVVSANFTSRYKHKNVSYVRCFKVAIADTYDASQDLDQQNCTYEILLESMFRDFSTDKKKKDWYTHNTVTAEYTRRKALNNLNKQPGIWLTACFRKNTKDNNSQPPVPSPDLPSQPSSSLSSSGEVRLPSALSFDDDDNDNDGDPSTVPSTPEAPQPMETESVSPTTSGNNIR